MNTEGTVRAVFETGEPRRCSRARRLVCRPDENAIPVATPQDPQLGDGFYWLFSSLTRKHPFIAALDGYSSRTKQVKVRENATTKAAFALAPGNT